MVDSILSFFAWVWVSKISLVLLAIPLFPIVLWHGYYKKKVGGGKAKSKYSSNRTIGKRKNG